MTTFSAPTIHSILVGNGFRPSAAREVAKDIPSNTELGLEREYDNAYDANAVKVLYKGEHIGYVKATEAAELRPWMDSGVEYGCYTLTCVDYPRNKYEILLKPKVADEAKADAAEVA